MKKKHGTEKTVRFKRLFAWLLLACLVFVDLAPLTKSQAAKDQINSDKVAQSAERSTLSIGDSEEDLAQLLDGDIEGDSLYKIESFIKISEKEYQLLLKPLVDWEGDGENIDKHPYGQYLFIDKSYLLDESQDDTYHIEEYYNQDNIEAVLQDIDFLNQYPKDQIDKLFENYDLYKITFDGKIGILGLSFTELKNENSENLKNPLIFVQGLEKQFISQEELTSFYQDKSPKIEESERDSENGLIKEVYQMDSWKDGIDKKIGLEEKAQTLQTNNSEDKEEEGKERLKSEDEKTYLIIDYTEEGQGKAGALFQVTLPDSSVTEIKSDENGSAILDNIGPGKYIISQKAAPAGYEIDQKKRIIDIDEEMLKDPVRLQFQADDFNERRLNIYVKDQEDKPLGNVAISLEGEGLKEVLRSDEKGFVQVDHMRTGTYYICQIEEGGFPTESNEDKFDSDIKTSSLSVKKDETAITSWANPPSDFANTRANSLKGIQAPLLAKTAISPENLSHFKEESIITNTFSAHDSSEKGATEVDIARETGQFMAVEYKDSDTDKSVVLNLMTLGDGGSEEEEQTVNIGDLKYSYKFEESGDAIVWSIDIPVNPGLPRVDYFNNFFTSFSNSGLGQPEIINAVANIPEGKKPGELSSGVGIGKEYNSIKEQEFGGSKTTSHAYHPKNDVARNDVVTVKYTVKTPIEEYRDTYALDYFYQNNRMANRKYASGRMVANNPNPQVETDSYLKTSITTPNINIGSIGEFDIEKVRKELEESGMTGSELEEEIKEIEAAYNEVMKNLETDAQDAKEKGYYYTLNGDYDNGFGSNTITYTMWVNPLDADKKAFKPDAFKGPENVSEKELQEALLGNDQTLNKVVVTKYEVTEDGREGWRYSQVETKEYRRFSDIPENELKKNQFIKYEVQTNVKDHTKDHGFGDAMVESSQIRPMIEVKWDRRMEDKDKREISLSYEVDGKSYDIKTSGLWQGQPIDKFDWSGNRKKFSLGEVDVPDDLVLISRGENPYDFTASLTFRKKREGEKDPSVCPLPGAEEKKNRGDYGVTYVEPIHFRDIRFGSTLTMASLEGFHDWLRGQWAIPKGAKKGEYFTLELPKDIEITHASTDEVFFHIEDEKNPGHYIADVYLDDIEVTDDSGMGPYENKKTRRLRFVITDYGQEKAEFSDLYGEFTVGRKITPKDNVAMVDDQRYSTWKRENPNEELHFGIAPNLYYLHDGNNKSVNKSVEFVSDWWESSEQEEKANAENKKRNYGNYIDTNVDVYYADSWSGSRGYVVSWLYDDSPDSLTFDIVVNSIGHNTGYNWSTFDHYFDANGLDYFTKDDPLQDFQVFEVDMLAPGASYVAGSEKLVWSKEMQEAGTASKQFNPRTGVGKGKFVNHIAPLREDKDNRLSSFVVRVKYKKDKPMNGGKPDKVNYHLRVRIFDYRTAWMIAWQWVDYFYTPTRGVASAKTIEPEEIKIKKQDKETENGLKGAVFNLHEMRDGIDHCIGTYVTDREGMATIPGLLPGKDYYLLESKAPEGYKIPEDGLKFDLRSKNEVGIHQYYYLVGPDGKEIKSSDGLYPIDNDKGIRVKIKKVNSLDHKLKLDGAVFELYEDKDDPKSKIGDSYTTGDDGTLIIQGIEAGKEYWLKEIKAPNGYNLLDDPWIGPFKAKVESQSDASGEMIETTTVELTSTKHAFAEGDTLTVENEPNPPMQILIYKYEETERGKEQIKEGKLEFKISSSDKNSSFKPITKEFDLSNDYQDHDGRQVLIWDGLDLPSGDYILEETLAPKGFIVPGTKYYLTVDRPSGLIRLDKIVNKDGKVVSTDQIELSKSETRQGEGFIITNQVLNIENKKPQYPYTGGYGSLIFLLFGCILMIYAAYRYKRGREVG